MYCEIPFFDNHTHVLDYQKRHYKPEDLSMSFLHGFKDIQTGNAGEGDISKEQAYHLENLGVVKTLVCMLSKKFACNPDLKTVTEIRNQRIEQESESYIKELYQEAGIIGCMIDSEYPMGDSRTKFPCKTFRLFQMDPLLDDLKRQCKSYSQLKALFTEQIRKAVQEGYAGIKCHIGERYTLKVQYVTEYEAEKAYASALLGDEKANEMVYFALFSELMMLCQEADIPIHIHTGCTGGSGNGKIGNLDPLLMAEYLNQREFQKTKIIFLHASYPFIRSAAIMTHMFPNIWMDLSWALPWTSFDFEAVLRAVLGVGCHSKILLGTGQHGIPEMSWMAAKIARSAISHTMDCLEKGGVITAEQGRETAEQLMYKNADSLYHFMEGN